MQFELIAKVLQRKLIGKYDSSDSKKEHMPCQR